MFVHPLRGRVLEAEKNVEHTTGGQNEGSALTGLSGRDLRQQLKKSPKPIIFDGGG